MIRRLLFSIKQSRILALSIAKVIPGNEESAVGISTKHLPRGRWIRSLFYRELGVAADVNTGLPADSN